MLGDARRCEAHGTVMTSAGTCVLCQRRTHASPQTSGRGMLWLLVAVVSAALLAIVGYRVHLTLADRTAMRAEPPFPSAPPAAAAEEEPSAAPMATAAPAPMPSEAEPAPTDRQAEHARLVADAERAVVIDLYGEGWCPSCQKARAWLDANGFSYTYRDTSNAVNKHTMRALNPKSTIPTIDIEGQVVVGFGPTSLRSAIRRAAEARVAKSAANVPR